MTRIIGITGGIASGKSTVSDYLKRLGYRVIDCDLLTREAYVTCFDQIQQLFPECIVAGTVDRKALAQCVFTRPQAKLQLEGIIHPYCRKKMTEAIMNQHGGILFLDIPLLYEAKMEDLCDEIWVVYVDFETQLVRLMARNQWSEEVARQRIAAQMPLTQKAKLADLVLNNMASKEELYQKINQRLGELDE